MFWHNTQYVPLKSDFYLQNCGIIPEALGRNSRELQR